VTESRGNTGSHIFCAEDHCRLLHWRDRLHDELLSSCAVESLFKIMNLTGARIRAVRAAEQDCKKSGEGGGSEDGK